MFLTFAFRDASAKREKAKIRSKFLKGDVCAGSTSCVIELEFSYRVIILRRFFYSCRHVGCICPAGFEGPHCEYPVKGFSVSAVVNSVSSKKSVGSIIGIVMGTFFGVALVFYGKERYIDKPKRDAERRAGHEHMFMARSHEMTSRRNKHRDIV